MWRWLAEECRIHVLAWRKDRLQRDFCALIDAADRICDSDLALRLEGAKEEIARCANEAEAILRQRYSRRITGSATIPAQQPCRIDVYPDRVN